MREASYRPEQLREIKALVDPLALGWTTPELVAAYFGEAGPKERFGATPLVVKLAAARAAQGVGNEPGNEDLDVQIAAKLLAMKLTTPELLRGSMFAAHPEGARSAMVETVEKLARRSRSWSMFHPGDDTAPKSKADRDADMLGKPRPADPRAADSDAPAKPETALDRGLQDAETAAIIARVRKLADAAPSYEARVAQETALRELCERPEGSMIVAELQRLDAVAQDRANAAADAQQRANQLRQMRGSTE